MDYEAIRKRQARLEKLVAKMRASESTTLEAVSSTNKVSGQQPTNSTMPNNRHRKLSGGKLQPLNKNPTNKNPRKKEDEPSNLNKEKDQNSNSSKDREQLDKIEVHDYCCIEDVEELNDSEHTTTPVAKVIEMLKCKDKEHRQKGFRFAIQQVTSRYSPQTDALIAHGIIPIIQESLKKDSQPDFQLNSLTVLKEISYGDDDQFKHAFGCLNEVINCLSCLDEHVVMQAVFVLGNFTGDSDSYTEEVIANGVLPKLISLVKKYNEDNQKNPTEALDHLKILVDTFNNICFSNDCLRNDIIDVVETCKLLLLHDNSHIQQKALRCFFHLSNSSTHNKEIGEAGVLPRVIELFYKSDIRAKTTAASIVEFMTEGTAAQKEYVIKAGGIAGLKYLLSLEDIDVKIYSARAIGNIFCGSLSQIQQTIDAGIVRELIKLAENSSEMDDVRIDALLALSAFAEFGTASQVKNQLESLNFSVFTEVLLLDDSTLTNEFLIGLASIANKWKESKPMIRNAVSKENLEYYKTDKNLSFRANDLDFILYNKIS